MSGGHFIRRLAEHFGLVSDEGLMGLTMIARELLVIDMDELVRLHICDRLGYTWDWVAPGPERQLAAAVGALENVEGTHAEVKGVQSDPTMVHVPQPPPAATTVVRTMPYRMGRLEEEVHEIRESLDEQREMSTKNGVNPATLNLADNSKFSLLSVLERERLNCPNYMDWMRNLRFTLMYENKKYVLDEKIPIIDNDSTQEEIEAHQKHYDDANKVSCIMASSMSHELQKTFENTWAYEINQQLKEMF
ncbi:hypothetical protein Tco_0701529 [Tanacetum coccineum]